jgi:hypothetical protein
MPLIKTRLKNTPLFSADDSNPLNGPPSGSKIVRTTGLLRVLYLIYGLVRTSYITSYEAHNPIIGETRLHCRVVLTMVVSNAKMTFMTTG